MLVLRRKKNEKITIAGGLIEIMVVDFQKKHGRNTVALGIQAPKEMRVDRAEVAARIAKELTNEPQNE